MSKVALVSLFVLIWAGSLLGSETPHKVSIAWYGQACFLITTPQGTKILTDPIDMEDYKVPTLFLKS